MKSIVSLYKKVLNGLIVTVQIAAAAAWCHFKSGDEIRTKWYSFDLCLKEIFA